MRIHKDQRVQRSARLVAGVAVLAACGGDEDTTADAGPGGVRTVEVEMVDIAFKPSTLEVSRGETVRFVFTNTGAVLHDAFIGDAAAQADHEAEMRGDHGGGHEDDHAGSEAAITVERGETGDLTYTFDDTGTVEVGCHEPGHYDAGMKITVEVG